MRLKEGRRFSDFERGSAVRRMLGSLAQGTKGALSSVVAFKLRIIFCI